MNAEVTTKTMLLEEAQKYARQIVEWLGPYVTRIEVAGSVRRQRPFCNDIDIVCIPKLIEAPKDLFGQTREPPRSVLREFFIEYVKSYKGQWRREGEGQVTEPKPTATNFLLKLPKCDLDVFAANEDTWVSRLVCRTGSKAHNIRVCERAQELGGKWEPMKGLIMAGELVPCASEQDFYTMLGWKYLKPEERE